MNQKKLNRKERGITLIALVITIIVLLILAGVAISMLSGENGILKQAASAKTRTEEKTEFERVQLAVLSALTAGRGEVDLTKPSDKENSIDKAINDEFVNDIKKPTYEEGKITLSNRETYNVTTSGRIEKESEAKWEWTDNQEEGIEGHGEISVGDLITYKEKTNEKFYVIKVDGDNVAMLAAKNITTTGTLEQSGSAPRVVFSYTNYWSSYAGTYPLDLNVYTDKTEAQKNTMGVKSTDAIEIARAYGDTFDVEGRLMTVEEVEDLEGSRSNYSTSDCPSFINTENYWLGSALNFGQVWIVEGESSSLSYGDYPDDYCFGVRPVLEIFKSSIN